MYRVVFVQIVANNVRQLFSTCLPSSVGAEALEKW